MKQDWRTAPLDPRQQALCGFAERLTLAPASMSRADVDALRAAGLDDRAVLDAVQVIGYFNYINRLVEALGVPLEDDMPARQGASS